MRKLINCFTLIATMALISACDFKYDQFISWDDEDQLCRFDWQCQPDKNGEERYCIPFNANPDQTSWKREMRSACMKPREKYEYCRNDKHCSGNNSCIKGHCQ